MEYWTVAETANYWGISRRRVNTLCAEERIPGVKRLGAVWMIPENSKKPSDARVKSGKYIKITVEENG